MSKHIPGIGCQCCAHSENECCCPDVDWRSAREVELEALVEKLEQQLATPVLNRIRAEGMREAAKFVETQRNVIPACGFEFAAAIRAKADELEKSK